MAVLMAAILVSQAVSPVSASPSFDCRRASASIEKIICASSDLSVLDQQLADAYAAKRRTLDAEGVKSLQQDQRLWLSGRLAACGIPARGPSTVAGAVSEDQATCVAKLYRNRIAALEDAAQSPISIAPSNELLVAAKKEFAQDNFRTAMNLWRKAADAGNTQAMTELGQQYFEGVGVPVNYHKGIEWWEKAAHRGNVDAMVHIADEHWYGVELKQDHDQAMNWYHRAAESGDPRAMRIFGNNTLASEPQEGLSWLRRAAEHNDQVAMLLLCSLYRTGGKVRRYYT